MKYDNRKIYKTLLASGELDNLIGFYVAIQAEELIGTHKNIITLLELIRPRIKGNDCLVMKVRKKNI